MDKDKVVKILGVLFFVAVIIFILSLVVAYPFMWIWNYAVVSAITIAKPITYWVAFWMMCFFSMFMVNSNSSS